MRVLYVPKDLANRLPDMTLFLQERFIDRVKDFFYQVTSTIASKYTSLANKKLFFKEKK